jgi:hypothetical protein
MFKYVCPSELMMSIKDEEPQTLSCYDIQHKAIAVVVVAIIVMNDGG